MSTEKYAELVEGLCGVMHDAYEAAAVKAGWETQERSRKPWADVPEANKVTMRAAVAAAVDALTFMGWVSPEEAKAREAAARVERTLVGASIGDEVWHVSDRNEARWPATIEGHETTRSGLWVNLAYANGSTDSYRPEFLTTTPPKPAEPTGRGAFVVDADGNEWTRTREDIGYRKVWQNVDRDGEITWATWDDLDIPADGVKWEGMQ
jgi:hypothetical protein